MSLGTRKKDPYVCVVFWGPSLGLVCAIMLSWGNDMSVPGTPFVVPFLDLLWSLVRFMVRNPQRNYKWEFRYI